MKNTLGDLNNHLFAQLERLSDEETKGEELKDEIERASAVTKIANQIISNGNLVLKAKQMMNDSFNENENLPPMLKG